MNEATNHVVMCVLSLLVATGCGRRGFTDLPAVDAAVIDDSSTDAAGDTTLTLALAFDEGGGVVAGDSSVYGNDGTLVGGAAFMPAVHGSGLAFAGGQLVSFPNSGSLDVGGGAMTISFWTRLDGADAVDDVLIAKAWQDGSVAPPKYQWAIEFNDNQDNAVEFFFTVNAASPVSALRCEVFPPLATFVHIAFTFDSAEARGYVDGVMTCTQAHNGVIPQRGQGLLLGIDPGLAQPFEGVLDDLRIYRRALTEAEINTDRITAIQ